MTRLTLVRDTTAAPAATSPGNVVELPITCHPGIARLTAAHDRACQAADHPLVVQQIAEEAKTLAVKLALPDHQVAHLIGAIRGGFNIGYVERDSELGDPAEELAAVFYLHHRGGDAS
jgi:hypothetical protein